MQQITVRRHRKDKNPIIVTYDFGIDLNDAVTKFNGKTKLENVVFDLFVVAARSRLNTFVSDLLERKNEVTGKPYTPAEIQAEVDAWKPLTQKNSRKAVARAAQLVEVMTEEEKEALRDKLGMN